MDNIEAKICSIIDEHRKEIIDFASDIWFNAELGFQEYRTASKFEEKMKSFGFKTETNLAITGVKSYLDNINKDLPTIALVGELDALPIPTHKDANVKTGASHTCGHNAQLAGVFGSAFALSHPEIKSLLNGNVVFFAVPAEEYVEIELRNKMREEGKLRYGCGKCELIRIGAFDDIDITVGHHSKAERQFLIANRSCNGFVTKKVEFYGKSSHAAGAPQNGIDAQNAATLAMHAVDMQRESFVEADFVRVHGFISKGATSANIIADKVTMEYSIRGKTIEAFTDASKKVDRAMRAGAIATGCGVTISTYAGNMPIVPVDMEETKAVREALEVVAGDTKITCTGPEFHSTSSGDFGDVSMLMPLLQFNTGGFKGTIHGDDLEVVDADEAYVTTAKLFALVAYNLLKNDGDYAKSLLASYKALLTKEEYIKLMDSFFSEEHIPMSPL